MERDALEDLSVSGSGWVVTCVCRGTLQNHLDFPIRIADQAAYALTLWLSQLGLCLLNTRAAGNLAKFRETWTVAQYQPTNSKSYAFGSSSSESYSVSREPGTVLLPQTVLSMRHKSSGNYGCSDLE